MVKPMTRKKESSNKIWNPKTCVAVKWIQKARERFKREPFYKTILDKKGELSTIAIITPI